MYGVPVLLLTFPIGLNFPDWTQMDHSMDAATRIQHDNCKSSTTSSTRHCASISPFCGMVQVQDPAKNQTALHLPVQCWTVLKKGEQMEPIYNDLDHIS